MSGSNDFLENMMREERNRAKEFQYKLISKWYWFLLFGMLGGAIAFLYSYYSPASYKAKTTILVQNESNNLKGKEFFEEEGRFTGVDIQDHIGILQSTSLSKQVINKLRWQTSWYQKMPLYNQDLYEREPFVVYETGAKPNPKNIPLFVSMLSDEEFLIRTDNISSKYPGMKDFSAKGKFGVPFENESFGFILEKNSEMIVPMGVEYFFVFNDLEGLSIKYAGMLSVSQEALQGNLITLELVENTPARAVDFVNELSRQYIEFCLAEKNRVYENTVRFIDMQLEGVVDSLTETGHLFSDFQSKNQSLNLDKEAELVVAELKKLEENYAAAERKLSYYKSLNNYLSTNAQFNKVEEDLQNNFGDNIGSKSILSPSVVDITDPVLNNLVLKLGELYSKKEILSISVKSNEPNMIILEREIKHTKSSLVENLQNLLVNAERDLKSIALRMQNIRSKLMKLPKIEQKFINIKRRYDLNNDLYTFLLKKRAEAEITIASNAANSQILDRASLLSTPQVGPRSMINLVVGFFLGILIPFVLIKTEDYFDNTIGSVSELEKESEIPVLGVIAHNKHRDEVLVTKRPRSGITESFRSLRTDIDNLLKDVNPKVISVQSVNPAEGKSFVSLNLAVILAMSHEKVLLVETDMRKPKLSEIFDLKGRSGLSSYLSEEANFEDVVNPTKFDNLSFIPAGPVPATPAELLANGQFESFMEQVKSNFNYVVMDSAPISIVTDGILSGKHADVNLFVLRHRYSKKGQVSYINKLVKKGSVENVVLVLNDFKTNGMGVQVGYKNGYYLDDYVPKTKAVKA
eukprot:TRINITY_DN225168_c0_g1_i1.p1 TRINITY_DN225168_c0_g1~~TRINITY_DN225168_c0_g1_i1.p1  ORF type:complete len:804 (-),score=47.19 TRINITY_DN225168_c0_g1_i1:4008-6419(-)